MPLRALRHGIMGERMSVVNFILKMCIADKEELLSGAVLTTGLKVQRSEKRSEGHSLFPTLHLLNAGVNTWLEAKKSLALMEVCSPAWQAEQGFGRVSLR